MTERPPFRKPKNPQIYSSPEQLFSKLPNRDSSHGYLRGPQAEVLQQYEKYKSETDIALELPTGTGKTTVGLLVAEWRRRQSGEKAAYLVLTNQLAGQVLMEAEKLGIECANLTGNKYTRDAAEDGKYRAGRAVGITTYSNLFNVNPVIQPSDVLILDDAHGGERIAAEMWTVRIRRNEEATLYAEVLTALRPALTDTQYNIVTDESKYGAVEIVDVLFHSEMSQIFISLLDMIDNPKIHYPWSLIRNQLPACLCFVSIGEIVIRPSVPPTHTHEPFFETKQRIYMSATLGGEGDLYRGYGITRVTPIRARHAQWGKRYIFMPGLCLNDDACAQLIVDVWNNMTIQRALLLSPSFAISESTFEILSRDMVPSPIKLGAEDIEESLESFTMVDGAILCLAGRYDGLDLPGENCRLLIMVESPSAVGALERHLRECWKMGPLLRRRERTRLVQGLGRCTRDATDFSVTILLGQSLINSMTNPAIVRSLPEEIQRELKWGLEQGEAAKKNPDALKEMILGLLTDTKYRKQANEILEEVEVLPIEEDAPGYDELGKEEVKYSKAIWAGNYSNAYQIARTATEEINGPELSGYRAWWWYLASIAARLMKNFHGEVDCLKAACATGINAGFLDHLLRKRSHDEALKEPSDIQDIQAEMIWNRLEQWGWKGPNFNQKLEEMKQNLFAFSEPTKFHIGLEHLGKCLGAEAMRPAAVGAPDSVWIFHNCCYTFEAKTDKKTGNVLSKRDVQQAEGHPNWVRANRTDLREMPINSLIVSTIQKIDEAAVPHVSSLNFISTDALLKFSEAVISGLQKIRTQFAGKEYGEVRNELKIIIRQVGLDRNAIDKLLTNPLIANYNN